MVLLSLHLAKFIPLIHIGRLVSLLLSLDKLIHLDFLILDIVDLDHHIIDFLLYLNHLLRIVTNLSRILLENGLQEELAITDATSPAHSAQLLDLRQRQLVQSHRLQTALLIGEYSQLVSASFAGFVPAELTGMLVVTFEFFVAHDALSFVGVLLPRRPLQTEDSLS